MVLIDDSGKLGRRFEGRRVAVIGAAPGQIGAAVVERIAVEGANVVVGDLHEGKARAVAEIVAAAGGFVEAEQVDIADDGSVARFFDRAGEALGGLDAMVNNAALLEATLEDRDMVEIDLEVMDRLLAVNVRGHMLSVRHAVPLMKQAGGGAIVLMASTSGMRGEPTRVAYGVAKAGVISLARHVASRWGKQGIRCNTISPGRIVTGEVPAADAKIMDAFLDVHAFTRLGEPSDIAGAVAFLLSDDAEFVNGVNLPVDAGFAEIYRPAPVSDEDFFHRFPFVQL